MQKDYNEVEFDISVTIGHGLVEFHSLFAATSINQRKQNLNR